MLQTRCWSSGEPQAFHRYVLAAFGVTHLAREPRWGDTAWTTEAADPPADVATFGALENGGSAYSWGSRRRLYDLAPLGAQNRLTSNLVRTPSTPAAPIACVKLCSECVIFVIFVIGSSQSEATLHATHAD